MWVLLGRCFQAEFPFLSGINAVSSQQLFPNPSDHWMHNLLPHRHLRELHPEHRTGLEHYSGAAAWHNSAEQLPELSHHVAVVHPPLRTIASSGRPCAVQDTVSTCPPLRPCASVPARRCTSGGTPVHKLDDPHRMQHREPELGSSERKRRQGLPPEPTRPTPSPIKAIAPRAHRILSHACTGQPLTS